MAYTFKGGFQLNKKEKKANISDYSIESAPFPSAITVPIPDFEKNGYRLTVSEGDAVTVGQVICESETASLSPVHATISGTVKQITYQNDCCFATIKNDFKNTAFSPIPCAEKISELSLEKIIETVRKAGIFDSYNENGISEPAFTKIQRLTGSAEKMIINCVETTPYSNAVKATILAFPEKVIGGMKILQKALSVRKAYLAVDNGNSAVVQTLTEHLPDSELAGLRILKNKFPQEFTAPLISALAPSAIPYGKTAEDCGYAVFSAECCTAIFDAFVYGKPYTHKVVSVISSPVEPYDIHNFLCPLGMPIRELLCVMDEEPSSSVTLFKKSILGQSVSLDDATVTKDLSAVDAVHSFSNKRTFDCIFCGRCAELCPSHILPYEIFRRFAGGKSYNDILNLHPELCIRCGLCSYICPARLPLAENIISIRNQSKSDSDHSEISHVKTVNDKELL